MNKLGFPILVLLLCQSTMFAQILLHGTLMDKNTNGPIQQATVRIQGGDQDVSDSNGSFSLDISKSVPVPKPGDIIELIIQFTTANKDYKNRIIPVTIPNGYNLKFIEIDKQYIYLYGKVVDAATGEPIEGVTVFLSNREVPLPQSERSTNTGPLGYFEFKFYQSQLGDLRLFNADFVDPAKRYKATEGRLYLGEREVVKMEAMAPLPPPIRYRVECRAGGWLNIVFSQPNKNSMNEPPIEECTEIKVEREYEGWVLVPYTYNGRAYKGWISKIFIESY